MSLTRIQRERRESSGDPNFRGAFAGGPALLSTEEMRGILDDQDLDTRITNALVDIRKRRKSKQAMAEEHTESTI